MKGKTIIIGAGVAGLTIASKLENDDYIILEARERIGGRVFTNDKNIDDGAAWVHGLCDNPLTNLIMSDDLIPVSECNPWMHSDNANITYYLGERSSPKAPLCLRPDGCITPPYNTSRQQKGGFIREPAVPLERRHAMAEKWNELISKTNEINGSTTIAEAFSFFSDDDDLRSFLYMIEVWCGGSIQNLPISFLQQSECKSALFGDYAGSHCLFKKGAKTLIESLSKGFINKIICNQIVTKIVYKTNEVEVHTREGLIYKCNKLCITVPPGPLRDIEFDPPLPQKKMNSLSHIKMGSYKKIQLEFDEVFWNDVPMILTRNEENEYILWNNYMVSKNMPILEAICPADNGFRLTGKSDEEIVDTVLDHLKLYFKNVPFPKS
jgi:monoamine oxidase